MWVVALYRSLALLTAQDVAFPFVLAVALLHFDSGAQAPEV